MFVSRVLVPVTFTVGYIKPLFGYVAIFSIKYCPVGGALTWVMTILFPSESSTYTKRVKNLSLLFIVSFVTTTKTKTDLLLILLYLNIL